MIKAVKISIGIIIGLVVLMQMVRPERISTDKVMESDIRRHMTVPEPVEKLLVRSCYDCHSMNTVWPWYSNFTPMSWLIAVDVKRGRQQLNLSIWTDYEDIIKVAKLSLICNTGKGGGKVQRKNGGLKV